MIRIIRRRLAIRSYRKRLRPYLEKHFGLRVNYTPKEVRSGASALGLPTVDLCYAYAMFCTPAQFAAHHAATGEHCDYGAMHAETMSFGTGYSSDMFSSSHSTSSGGWFGAHKHNSSGREGHDFADHDSGGGHDSGSDGGGSD